MRNVIWAILLILPSQALYAQQAGTPDFASQNKDMLVGSILAVSRHDVVKTGVLYGAIGVFHYIFRRRFLLISTDPEQAEAQGISLASGIFCSTHRSDWS